MKFGICTSPTHAALAREQGWDYIEGNTQSLLQGQRPDAQWDQQEAIAGSALPVLACNMMVPGELKITGPAVEPEALHDYMDAVLRRAGQVGIRTIVFGSAGARNVPEGFDRDTARQQIIDFARMFAPLARGYGVTVVAEPLQKAESNLLNTVAEAMEIVQAVDHPGFRCLVDSYHFWKENEPLENLRHAMPWIRHVHVADLEGRVAPGMSGTSDYQPFFKTLKAGGYDGLISIECDGFELQRDGEQVLAFLRQQWERS